MSHTIAPLTLVSAFRNAENILGKNRRWEAVNKEQVVFLQNYLTKTIDLSLFSPDELRSYIGTNADALNSILAKEGVDTRLRDFHHQDGVAVISLFNVFADWVSGGIKKMISAPHDDKVYPGVFFSGQTIIKEGKAVTVFESFSSMITDDPIILLHTKSGDKLFMTVAEGEVWDFELINAIEAIRGSNLTSEYCHSVTFPMVDYSQHNDLSWPIGMNTIGANREVWNVALAFEETKFAMNQYGARLKCKSAVGIRPLSLKTLDIIIDQPFLLWIERPGVETPLLYGYFDEKDWKDPGNLEL